MEMISISESRIKIKLRYLFLIETILSILNIFSVGLFYPFFLFLRYTFVYSKTQISNKQLKFNGNFFKFYYYYLYWYFLTLITLGIYHPFLEFKMYKWAVKSTYIDGEKKDSYFSKDILETVLLNILTTFIIVITFGLGYPIVKCIKYRYRLRNTFISGKNLCFVGNSKDLTKKYLQWIILSIVTLGLFIIFIPVLEEKYRVENTIIYDEKFVNIQDIKETEAIEYVFLNLNNMYVKIFMVLGIFTILLAITYILFGTNFLLIFIDLLIVIELLFLFDVSIMFLSKLYNNKIIINLFIISILLIIISLIIISLFLNSNIILLNIKYLIINISFSSLLSLLIFLILIFKRQRYL